MGDWRWGVDTFNPCSEYSCNSTSRVRELRGIQILLQTHKPNICILLLLCSMLYYIMFNSKLTQEMAANIEGSDWSACGLDFFERGKQY